MTPANRDRVIKLRGLSWNANVDDVREFFKDYDLSDSDVIIETKENGKKTGFALIFMPTVGDRDEAIKVLDRKNICNRYVELFAVDV